MDNTDGTVFGIRTIMEAIATNVPLQKVYLQRGIKNPLFQKLENLIRENGISSSYVPIEKMERLSKGNHQGAIATISPVAFEAFEPLIERILQNKENPLFLLLDQITDVRNFGAILRTAECTGVDAVIIPNQGSAPLNPDAIKTSAGAAFMIPISKTNHLLDAIYYLQSVGVEVLAATEKTDELIYDLDLTKPLALIMGAEDRGIAPAILKTANYKAKLPLLGEIGSLNVSVACGAVLYEIVRQRIPK
jgi:23S rRNA (guanosine2251-2'-O)-methyltransferase